MSRAARIKILKLFKNEKLPFLDDLETANLLAGATLASDLLDSHVISFVAYHNSSDTAMLYKVKIIAYMSLAAFEDAADRVKAEVDKLTPAGTVLQVRGNVCQTFSNYRSFVYQLPEDEVMGLHAMIHRNLKKSGYTDTKNALNIVEGTAAVRSDNVSLGVTASEVLRQFNDDNKRDYVAAEKKAYEKANNDRPNRLIENGGIELINCGDNNLHRILRDSLQILEGLNPGLAQNFNRVIRFKILLMPGLDSDARRDRLRYALFKLATALRNYRGLDGKKVADAKKTANKIFHEWFDGRGIQESSFKLRKIIDFLRHPLRVLFRDNQPLAAEVSNIMNSNPGVVQGASDAAQFLQKNPDRTEEQKRLESRIQKLRRDIDMLEVESSFDNINVPELDEVVPRRTPLLLSFRIHTEKLSRSLVSRDIDDKPIVTDPTIVAQLRNDELQSLQHKMSGISASGDFIAQVLDRQEATVSSAILNRHVRELAQSAQSLANTQLHRDHSEVDASTGHTVQADQMMRVREKAAAIEESYNNILKNPKLQS